MTRWQRSVSFLAALASERLPPSGSRSRRKEALTAGPETDALLANYGDDGVPLGDSALSIDPSLSSDPATLSAEDPADLQASLSSFFADLKSSVDLSVTYPSPVSVTSATPAPSEVSSQSRGSSSSVEPEAQTAVAADAQTEASSSSSSSSSSKKKGSASSKRRYWTAEQDAALVKLREEPDKHDWTWNEIAAKLDCGHRSVQCRARYLLLKDKQKSASRNRSRRISWPRDADLRRLHLAVKAADEDAKAQGRKSACEAFKRGHEPEGLTHLLNPSQPSTQGATLRPPTTPSSSRTCSTSHGSTGPPSGRLSRRRGPATAATNARGNCGKRRRSNARPSCSTS